MPDITREWLQQQLELAEKAETPTPWSWSLENPLDPDDITDCFWVIQAPDPELASMGVRAIIAQSFDGTHVHDGIFIEAACNTHADLCRAHLALMDNIEAQETISEIQKMALDDAKAENKRLKAENSELKEERDKYKPRGWGHEEQIDTSYYGKEGN